MPHFTPKQGWLNDPNGLVYFKGAYHAFYQYCPSLPATRNKWWGHAVSTDLVHWDEWEPALKNDTPADENGVWSGSAIVRDDTLYLFYTGLREEGQGTESYVDGHGRFGICLATSTDGVHFVKHSSNPLIPLYPPDGDKTMRDPSVSCRDGVYYMALAARQGLLYRSDDLIRWDYVGVPLPTGAIECPDLRPFGDGDDYLYIFSQGELAGVDTVTKFAVGRFDGKTFTPRLVGGPERGPHFYAPQTLRAPDGRTLMLGWMYAFVDGRPHGNGTPPVAGVDGQLSIPREITVRDGKICSYPPAEWWGLLADSDPDVVVTADSVELTVSWHEPLVYRGEVREVKVYREANMLEVFINRGEAVFSYCY